MRRLLLLLVVASAVACGGGEGLEGTLLEADELPAGWSESESLEVGSQLEAAYRCGDEGFPPVLARASEVVERRFDREPDGYLVLGQLTAEFDDEDDAERALRPLRTSVERCRLEAGGADPPPVRVTELELPDIGDEAYGFEQAEADPADELFLTVVAVRRGARLTVLVGVDGDVRPERTELVAAARTAATLL